MRPHAFPISPAIPHRPARALAALALALAVFGAGAGAAQTRYGDMSPELVVQTDELHGGDCLWQGPRGLAYALLPDAEPIQKANLYPDGKGSYWVANFSGIPQGTEIMIHGTFPYTRYMSYGVVEVNPVTGAAVSTPEHFADVKIVPEPGSKNPFVAGARRDTKIGKREYRVLLIAEDPPADASERRQNALYLGADGTAAVVYRTVLPDVGLDGAGGVGLPRYKAKVGQGPVLKGQEVCDQLVTPLTQGTPPGMTLNQWLFLRSQPYANPPLNDPATMPARNPSLWEKFWNGQYSFAGLFFPPAVRATIPYNNLDFGANADTTFVASFINRQFGPVYVLRGKMPAFPDTYAGTSTMGAGDLRYWSITQNDAPPSGRAYDSISDFQVPRDVDGDYVIVVSRPEDRPANAIDACGVAWMDWGTEGEGIPAPYNRPDFGLLIMRFELESPDWASSGMNVLAPGQEPAVMGSYFPRGEYTSTAGFEALGCPAQ